MISIIIPVLNEEKSIAQLKQEIDVVFKKQLTDSYEILFVNDGSIDNSQKEIEAVVRKDPQHVKYIEFRTNFGKAAALRAGFEAAKGTIIVQMDGDLQDRPDQLPHLIKKLHEGYELVVGWKQHRQDSFIKNTTSQFFNWVTNLISRVHLHDHNCGLKAYKAQVAKELLLYGELHRYIAVVASAKGYRIAEVPIEHRKRQSGASKYGISRFINGFLDLLTVIFITKFKSRPLHFFGYIGLLCFFFGLLIAIYLTAIKFIGSQSIGDRPLLLFSVMLMIMGVQIGVTGIVGEQIATMMHRDRGDYVIKKSSL